jgi:hypothetical protein
VTEDDPAKQLSAALLKPLYEVATMLAAQIDDLTAAVNELQQHVKALPRSRFRLARKKARTWEM